MIPGIDVSHHQGEIDWPRVRAAGVRFAYIKATEGRSFTDHRFAFNWREATTAGVVPGAYHFGRPDLGESDPKLEARHFLETLGEQPKVAASLPPCLDLEVTGGLAPEPLAEWAARFLAEVRHSTGRTPTLYVSPGFWRGQVIPGMFPEELREAFAEVHLWVAHWTSRPDPALPEPWDDWTFWQTTSRGSVDGIDGNVDLNRYAGTMDDLLDLAGWVPARPEPEPPTQEPIVPRLPVLRRGAGYADLAGLRADVRRAQALLIAAGFGPDGLTVRSWGRWTARPDGRYGPRTEDHVRAFQAANALTADGVVGPNTWGALLGL